MEEKPHYTTIITTQDLLDLQIYPDKSGNIIVVEVKELDNKGKTSKIYLNEKEMELLIAKMRETMRYILT
jgi:hypothetical protein